MRFDIEAAGCADYGDYATVRIYFDEQSWIEVDAADAHDINRPRSDKPYGQGAKVTVHHADGSEEVVWDDLVMPMWFAKRQAEARG